MAEESPVTGEPEQPFRWQALFQRSEDALFLLNRRRAILFVNRAWEKLTGLSASEARHLVCRRRRPVTTADTPQDILSYLLCPPPEAPPTETVRVRRLLPGSSATPRWWDVEFTPLRGPGGKLLASLGRIIPLPVVQAEVAPALPPRLSALRQQVQRRLNLFLPGEDTPVLRRLAEQVRLAAQVTTPVVLIGEPGSGRQTLARLIHAHSPQRERSFAALDCTRLPAWSVAALLLTDAGAGQRRQLGAIYLHEPGRLPRDIQLLLWERLLQSLEATSEGEETEAGQLAPPDRLPRLLAGFADPREQLASGQLLQELFCGLDTLRLELPALRERPAELPLLIERCLARLNSDGEKSVSGLAPALTEMLARYPWPGNLAELLQTLDQARQRTTEKQITLDDLPLPLRLQLRLEEKPGRQDQAWALDRVMEQVERRLILLTLQRTGGNKTRAAELLGLFRPRLLSRMKALRITDPAAGQAGTSAAPGSEE